ncbi:hypothetical protein CXB51_032745 [Gossypium anomalum]|uniref:Uncharacterized protein n=1 Tax=Gossypium anomalum TaxID=47600 RepID=A0A8J5YEB4_9ROSI|nr:hypothetical protein CXB51_032745 [Gossypium anomalum]
MLLLLLLMLRICFCFPFPPTVASEDAVSFDRAAGLETLGWGWEWEVLFNTNSLELNPDMDENAEHFFADHDNYICSAELFVQFTENENAYIGRPPAKKSAVKSLRCMVVTQENMTNTMCFVQFVRMRSTLVRR